MKTISPPVRQADRVCPKGRAFFSALRLESHPSGGFPVFLIVVFRSGIRNLPCFSGEAGGFFSLAAVSRPGKNLPPPWPLWLT
jgi:hypothetical protein